MARVETNRSSRHYMPKGQFCVFPFPYRNSWRYRPSEAMAMQRGRWVIRKLVQSEVEFHGKNRDGLAIHMIQMDVSCCPKSEAFSAWGRTEETRGKAGSKKLGKTVYINSICRIKIINLFYKEVIKEKGGGNWRFLNSYSHVLSQKSRWGLFCLLDPMWKKWIYGLIHVVRSRR